MAHNSSQGIYSPLPQSLSDSDSEKEVLTVVHSKFIRPAQNGFQNNAIHNGYIRTSGKTVDMPEERKSQKKMSSLRMFCFVLSIVVCFLTIAIFLWVLPCTESGTCPIKISNWETQHEGIEFTGKINVVKSAFKHTYNLALLFKRNVMASDSQNGAISVLGNNGAVAWYIPQSRTPTNLNCYLLDINGDDITDCLLLGERGIEAVDPVSGTIFWHVHSATRSKPILNLNFPVVIDDFNNDGIKDLLTSSNSDRVKNKIFFISGKNGLIIGELIVKQCQEIGITNVNITSVVYLCKNGTNLDYVSESLEELISKLYDKDEVLTLAKIDYIPPADTEYVLNKRKLKITNVGSCPNGCNAHIALIDDNHSQEMISWSYSNSYAMKPTSFSFKPTKMNINSLKGHINGFILKLWQWSGYSRKNLQPDHSQFPVHNVTKRNIPTNNASVHVNTVMERVVLITFNDTNVHVINASLTEIMQLCFMSDDSSINCQPDLMNQNDSLLISDLDMDGSQELISYSSTFVRKNEARDLKDNWQLISNMKVIRLEAELPKLYETAK